MSQGYPLTKLYSSIEQKPSPLHGSGIFATSSITPGEYSILPTDPKIVEMVEKFSSVNSAMMPVWKDILLMSRDGDGDDDIDVEDEDDGDDDFMQRLDKFRKGFAAFIEDEKCKANISSAAGVRAVVDGVDFVVNVLRDLDEGEELLRPYGREWMAIKYYNLKSCMLHYRESVRKGEYSGDLFISIDVKTLHATMWEFKSRVEDATEDTNAELGTFLSKREGKELIVVSPEELNSMANIIGMVAIEFVDTGDESFDYTWKHNIRKLRSHFPRQVVNPASFATKAVKKQSNDNSNDKQSKKKRKHGKVEKLKHGAFDVYTMKM